MGQNFHDCARAVEVLRNLFLELGFKIQGEKSVFSPTRQITFLGYILNSSLMKVFPTEDKIKNGLELVRETRAKDTLSIRQLDGVIGVLNDLTKGCEYGPAHYRQLERDKTRALARNKGDFEAPISISDWGSKDLDWWTLNLPRAQRRIRVESPLVSLTTDTCDYRWGAVFKSPGRDKVSTNGVWSVEEKKWHINVKETMAVCLGLITFAKNLRGCQIQCFIDNTMAIAYVNHQGA